MRVLSDTKKIYGRLTADELKGIAQVLDKYTPIGHIRYKQFVRDRKNGVLVYHQPRLACANYDTVLQFHGYSNSSPLLKEIFAVVPVSEWLVKRLDVAFDTDIPYNQTHVIHPPKPAKMLYYDGSLYMGGKTSEVRCHTYDKQKEQKDKRGIQTPTWTRSELRFQFKPMVQVKELTLAHFESAKDYTIITDINQLPPDQQEIVDKLNHGQTKWRDLTRTMKAKIKKYGIEQGTNLYDLILSAGITDISSFIYQAEPNQTNSKIYMMTS